MSDLFDKLVTAAAEVIAARLESRTVTEEHREDARQVLYAAFGILPLDDLRNQAREAARSIERNEFAGQRVQRAAQTYADSASDIWSDALSGITDPPESDIDDGADHPT